MRFWVNAWRDGRGVGNRRVVECELCGGAKGGRVGVGTGVGSRGGRCRRDRVEELGDACLMSGVEGAAGLKMCA